MKFESQWGTVLWLLTLVSGIILLPTGYVHAYLDPGSGSFLLQALVAGFLGMLFALRIFRQRVSLFFRQLLGRQSSSLEEPAEE